MKTFNIEMSANTNEEITGNYNNDFYYKNKALFNNRLLGISIEGIKKPTPIDKLDFDDMLGFYLTEIDTKSKEELIEEIYTSMKKQIVLSEEDEEVAHRNGDMLLCLLLKTLGHGAIVELFDDVNKWYS
ncbi:MAG: hypothetical protein ABIP51_05545 [Bacteroidia bacterium]